MDVPATAATITRGDYTARVAASLAGAHRVRRGEVVFWLLAFAACAVLPRQALIGN